jgi:hypothetical protein
MSGDEHRHSVLDQPIDVGPELAPDNWGDTRSRLVEKQYGRLMHDGTGERMRFQLTEV